jgi:hypothetical protein
VAKAGDRRALGTVLVGFVAAPIVLRGTSCRVLNHGLLDGLQRGCCRWCGGTHEYEVAGVSGWIQVPGPSGVSLYWVSAPRR